MKKYEQFGIYDFEDFAEELNEQELLFVNGGSCGGTITPTNPTPTSTATTPTYGECGGKIADIPPTGPSVPQVGTVIFNCGGGNIVITETKRQSLFMNQRDFSETYSTDFGMNACAATSLLNEVSELYTKRTGKTLTVAQLNGAMEKATNNGSVQIVATDKELGTTYWEKAANTMAEVLNLKGSFTYTNDSSKADIIVYAWDKSGDGAPNHFVNDIGNGKYYDPLNGTIGNVKDLQLATKGNGGTRYLTYKE